jgi:hypothetical protein
MYFTSYLSIALLFFISFTPKVIARRGLSVSSLSPLTRGTDYTFHSICADFHNPDVYFDEVVIHPLSDSFSRVLYFSKLALFTSHYPKDYPFSIPVLFDTTFIIDLSPFPTEAI